MTESLEDILLQLKNGELSVDVATKRICDMFEDRSLRDGFAMAGMALLPSMGSFTLWGAADEAYKLADEMMSRRQVR